ncbi:MAG: hypothetical protein AAB336_06135 [Acidobacteriota bacterium]
MTSDVLQKLKIPSIGLLISGVFSGFIGLIALISGIVRFSGIGGKEILPTDQAERFGYLLGTFGIYGIAVISLILSPLMVFGAIRMMKGRNRGLAITSAILSILPLTSCCFFIGAIFGVWSLVVLMQADVKSFFQNGGEQTLYPPQPPQSW